MIPLWSPGLLIIFRMEHSEYKIFHFYLHTLSQNNFCKSCSKRYFTGFGSSDFSFYIKIPFTQKSLLLFQKWFPISSNLHIPELLNNCHSLFSEHLFWSLWNIYILFLSHLATSQSAKWNITVFLIVDPVSHQFIDHFLLVLCGHVQSENK